MTTNAALQLSPDGHFPAVPTAPASVSVAGGQTIVSSPNLPLALARARATALRGYPVWLHDEAGRGVAITAGADGPGLCSTSPIDPPWLDRLPSPTGDHG